MDKTKSYFTYSPPKSNSHGHASRDKNIKRALTMAVDAFVNNFGATRGDDLQLTLYYDKNDPAELQKAQRTIEKVKSFLGKEKKSWDNTGHPHMKNSIGWSTGDKTIFELFDFLEPGQDDTLLPLENYWVCCFYSYGKPDEPIGQAMISIEQGRLFVRLHLIIPYTTDDERSYDLLSRLFKELPFKLNSKHFRRLGPGKNGYGQWKLNQDEQKRLDACFT